jgi:enoyl-CoA hydratase
MPETPASARDGDHAAGDDDVRFEVIEPGIGQLVLSRPAVLNALTDASVAAIRRRLDAVDVDPALRVLIVTGEGRAFSAGFDLSQAESAPGEADLGAAPAWTARQEAFASLITRLRALRQPVIAAVNGFASGGGLAIALACEIRVAARSAAFNAAFVKIGMSGCDMGVSWLLPRCVGMSRAFDILLTGRMVDSTEAERIGLVSETVDDARLPARALEVARAIAANDAFAVWMTKRGTWANAEAASLQAAMELENRTQILARSTGALAAAARDFKARRPR